jgi:hypothetical protein
MMNTEELSKIWSVLFQTPYVLSFACQGGAVLIEGQKPGRRPLPVRRTEFYTTPSQPTISQVIADGVLNQPITATSTIMIRGQQLTAEISEEQLREMNGNPAMRTKPLVRGLPQIRIGEAQITPTTVTDTEIRLELGLLSAEEKNKLRSGVQSLQVVYPILPKRSDNAPDRAIGSNVVPFVLCPAIEEPIAAMNLDDNGDGFYTANVEIRLDLAVEARQRVFLFLNERTTSNPTAYIFSSISRDEPSHRLVFPIRDVKAGEYLVRVQIDGAESLLNVDSNIDSSTFDQYISPIVDIR